MEVSGSVFIPPPPLGRQGGERETSGVGYQKCVSEEADRLLVYARKSWIKKYRQTGFGKCLSDAQFTTELASCCDIILTHLCDLTVFKSTVLNSGSESDLELNEKSPPENRHSQPLRLTQQGPAENLIRSIRGITNWSQMKEHLLNEFSDRINSAQLHNMIQARRLKPTETLQEYFLTMQDLAHKGAVDDSSLIDYIIDGIPDSSNNKIILYGYKTLSEFKG
ncbi:retrovirus-related Pol polyprotein from transposon gypsy [Trichonephila clavipes]|nr:retrovirus-related Pol polyprotein from transposon gypsy [Trichonephila clavipes]